ncbi:ABC transporter, substrate-binding protein, family 3 [Neisseria sp. oral taxon 020 str. F0370]|nr:ABC transporter, substrate-binding protein, family 3 [Neisseria sp. oral taxon 020 str. F0370]
MIFRPAIPTRKESIIMISLRRFMPLVVVFSLAACGDTASKGKPVHSEPAVENSTQDSRPVQNVFFEAGGFAPFVMSDTDNRPSGFGIDLVNAIGDKQGFRTNYIPHPFTGMLEDLGKGADIAVAAITVTDERKAMVDFTNPHFDTSMALIVPEDSPITSIGDVKGKNIAVVVGTVGEPGLAKLQGGKGIITRTPSVWAATREVMRKNVDGAFADAGPLNYYANTYKEQKLRVISDGSSAKNHYALAVTKGKTELLNKLNQGLEQIKADGTYDKIYQKWFPTDQGKPTPAPAK